MNAIERDFLIRNLAAIEAALLTSFGPETSMLLGLQYQLRVRLGLVPTESEQTDRPVAA